MGKVVADISMSLDGYVAAPGADLEHGLGIGGEVIHGWVFAGHPIDAEILHRGLDETGAVVMGRRLFDFVDGPHGWTDELGYGAGTDQATGGPPVVVVTHAPPSSWRLGPRFRFAEDICEAVARARFAAGDRTVVVMGGAEVVRQSVLLGLADELRIHLSPCLTCGGTPLFPPGAAAAPRLRQVDVVASPHATHLTYEVLT
ncbi:dihydrofolate reductase family protein [Asanoa sp. WMMD1127]|uniref:dihydrofolate reductase family protein n=1 Tax=Asanoa sp. WMMD1127 TaxID=3016107 RepID=UPI00241616A3|nr:dihydrofolate reductase family protein [Asanoa sp. WMMD1127]MDG4826226.1 dihydrofolate reductase family protein [Asanoa sp. WMMD1127]